MRDDSPQTYVYDPVQRGFHWLMAALILLAICIGLYAAHLPKADHARGGLFALHKSLGMTILILAALRIGWRLVKGAPPYRVALEPWMRLSASAAHAALYVLMFAMPILGYVLSTAGDHPVPFFGLFTFPRLLAVDKPLSHAADLGHVWGAWILIAVLTVHILAALWHHWYRRDEILTRMAPRIGAKETGGL